MSKTQPSSSTPSPSSSAYTHPTPILRLKTAFDVGSPSHSPTPAPELSTPAPELSTPAPEPSTPAVASTSAATPEYGGEAPPGADAQPSEALQPSYMVDLEALAARVRARGVARGRTPDETERMLQTATQVATSLAADHLAVLYPDVDTPFTDAQDAVRRLLPYHVFQQPKAGLNPLLPTRSRKGKSKATEQDLLRDEIAETKSALQCWRRRKALQDRFRRAKTRLGKQASPEDQLYALTQSVLETERTETASLNAELRNARVELDRMQREQRAAAAAPPPPPAPQPTPSYYGPHTTAGYASQYRPFTYPYGQNYGPSQYTYNPAAYAAAAASYAPAAATTSAYTSTTARATAPAPTAAYTTAHTPSTTTTVYTPPSTIPGSTVTSTASAQVQQAQAQTQTQTRPVSAIPVNLPSLSLPALAAIGIQPVPAASVPPPDQKQPAAVLKGQTGTTMSLEINVGSLDSSQMSGLALILNALTSRGVNVDGVPGSAGTTGAAATAVASGAATQKTG